MLFSLLAIPQEWITVAFLAFDLIAVLVVAIITYRWFFKRFSDIFLSGFCLILLSPLFLILTIAGKIAVKKNKLSSVLQFKTYVGKKKKTIRVYTFCHTDENGKESKYGKFLYNSGFYKLPLLAMVFTGKLSFIGPLAMTPTDAYFLDEDEEARLQIRPGIIQPMVISHKKNPSYEDMFQNDEKYIHTFSFGKDFKIFHAWLIKKIRGHGKSYLGEAEKISYAEILLSDERISQEDFDNAQKLFIDQK